MPNNHSTEGFPLSCDRCLNELRPGEGNFYVVRIEAVADPSPPVITAEDLQRDHRAEMESLFVEMQNLSEQELLDQVYHRLTLYLCGSCYQCWIQDPMGR